MIRGLVTALLCGAAIVAGDLLFRTSLLGWVRPIILSPREHAVLHPPVELHWDGPSKMHVRLTAVGSEPRDLGVQQSPFLIGSEELLREGGYRVEIESVTFGGWIGASRLFQVYSEASAEPPQETVDNGNETRFLMQALDAVRRVRDRARGRAKQYRHENNALRDEAARLADQVEALQEVQDDDLAHAEDLESRLMQLANEYRALSEENTMLRMRLETVIPCTVWGYFSYPRQNTIPATRQIVSVSDNQARVYRTQADCEGVRRDDPTASSTCFCVGNSWGR